MLRDRLTRPLRAVRRAVLARRRLLAALLAAVAVAGGLHAAAAPPPPTVPVLTAARDLPAGAVVLGRPTWSRRTFAPGTAPAGLSPTTRSAAPWRPPLRRGEPVTDVRLVGPALTAGDPTSHRAPVRLPDAAMVDLLEVGDVSTWSPPTRRAAGRQRRRRGGAGARDPALPSRRRRRRTAGCAGRGRRVRHRLTAIADAGVRLFLTYAYSR